MCMYMSIQMYVDLDIDSDVVVSIDCASLKRGFGGPF